MHWFLDPVTQHYADFSGRATRQQFWMYMVCLLVLYFGVGIIEGILGTSFLVFIVGLALLIPGIAITTRRLHDIGKSGWWQLIGFIPVIGFIVMIYFLVQKSVAAEVSAETMEAPAMTEDVADSM